MPENHKPPTSFIRQVMLTWNKNMNPSALSAMSTGFSCPEASSESGQQRLTLQQSLQPKVGNILLVTLATIQFPSHPGTNGLRLKSEFLIMEPSQFTDLSSGCQGFVICTPGRQFLAQSSSSAFPGVRKDRCSQNNAARSLTCSDTANRTEQRHRLSPGDPRWVE